MSHQLPQLDSGVGLNDEEKGRPSLSHHEHQGPRGHLDHEEPPMYDEKQRVAEVLHEVGEVAAVGEVATDQYGRPIVHFDPKAEKRLVRKLDFFTVPTVALLYLFTFIDRTNIGNARLANFERDLHLTGVDFNAILSVFYISYILFEIPSNIMCKIVGPGRWLPLMTLGFGIISLCTAFITNFSSACGVRFLLGIFEAGLLPGISYYFTRWYRKSELAFRISLYICASPLGGAFSGLLASGILKISHIGSVRTWAMLFLVEGLITIGLGFISFFTLTDRPETARWLNPEEKALAIARIKSENVGTKTVLDKIDKRKLILGILNPNTAMCAWIFLLDNVTAQSMAFFLPTIVATIYPKNSVVSKQLHAVPPFVVGAVSVVVSNFLAWKLNKRLIIMMILAPLPIVGYIMFLASEDPHVRYGATFIIAIGSFPFGALCPSQAAANTLSDSARSAGIGLVMVMGNIGGLIATWAFPKYDEPNYPIGNGLNLATNTLLFLSCVILYFWLKWDNRRRDRVDMDEALADVAHIAPEDLDWKHPAFRWRY